MSCKVSPSSVPASHFEEVFKNNPDPWHCDWKRDPIGALKCLFYEQRRYWNILRTIPRKRYRHGLELGCATGIFTQSLAKRCERLLAIDYSETAIAFGRRRCRKLSQVRFEHARIPDEFPEGNFDLIILSEVAYYLSMADFLTTVHHIVESLTPGGHFLMVHCRNHREVPLPGDLPHDTFIKETADVLTHLQDRRRPRTYRLDLFEKPIDRSSG